MGHLPSISLVSASVFTVLGADTGTPEPATALRSVVASGERHLTASARYMQAHALTSLDGPLLGSSCLHIWACTPGRWAGCPYL